jgi:DNA-binding transcriptional ArsR family regulator
MTRDLFQAIADPTRREILKLIFHRSLNIGTIAESFNVSRTAVYKHIKILINCDLIKVRKKGRERYCEAKLDKLKEISDWVEQYNIFWLDKVNSFEQYVELIKAEKKVGKKKSSTRK